MTAMCGTTLVIAGAARLTSIRVAFSGIGSNSSSAAIRLTIPTIAASGANSRMPKVSASAARPPSRSHLFCEPPEPLLEGGRGQRIAREDIAQGAEHRDAGGEHPAARGDRDALPAHHTLGTEREGR